MTENQHNVILIMVLNNKTFEMKWLVLPIIRMTRSIIRITVITIAIIIKISSPMVIFPFVCVIFIVAIGGITYTRFSIIPIPVAHCKMRKTLIKTHFTESNYVS